MKTFRYIWTIAAAAIGLSSCVKEAAMDESSLPAGPMVDIELNTVPEIGTKTHYDGTMKIKWDANGENLQVIEYDGKKLTAASTDENPDVTPDGVKAKFSFKMPQNTGTSLDYWAIHPNTSFVSQANENLSRYQLYLPQNQYPKDGTFDPSADLLVSSMVHQTAQPKSLDFSFNRLVAVIELQLDGITSGEKISTVTVSNTTQTLSGVVLYDMNKNLLLSEKTDKGNKKIVLNCLGVPATGNDKVFFTSYPAQITDLTIEVLTNMAKYTKKSNVAFELKANHKVKLSTGEMVREELGGGSLEADFLVDKSLAQLNTPVSFTDKTAGAVSWNWDFGDGQTSVEQNPNHKYTKPGLYTVKLAVSNGSESGSVVKEKAVTVYGKQADGFLFTYEVLIPSAGYQLHIGAQEKLNNGRVNHYGFPQFTGTVHYGNKTKQVEKAVDLDLVFDEPGNYLVALEGKWEAADRKLRIDQLETKESRPEIIRLIHLADIQRLQLGNEIGRFKMTLPNLEKIETGFLDECPKMVSMDFVFFGAKKLKEIPEGLLDKLIVLQWFNQNFRETGITSIPTNLFAHNPKLEYVSQNFRGTKITQVPAGLFADNPNIKELNSSFQQCTELTSIPTDIFKNKSKLENINAIFDGCSKIRSIPQGLLDNLQNLQKANTIFNCCFALEAIPSGFFKNNRNLKWLESAFGQCGKLTSIPADLFVGSYDKMEKIANLFNGCKNLQGPAPTIWDGKFFPHLKTHNAVFANCTKLSNYKEIPVDWTK